MSRTSKRLLPCLVGRKPCGCVVQVVVGGNKSAEELSHPGLRFEEWTEREPPAFNLCQHGEESPDE
jgi:hypothetical protein